MTILRTQSHTFAPVTPVVLTFGNFDGLHVGHQALLARTCERARELGLRSVALTFDPHPVSVFRPETFRLIEPLSDRLRRLEAAGIDDIVVVAFTPELAAHEADSFVSDWLLSRFLVRHVVIGFDTTFGRGRTGDPAQMHELGTRLGFGVETVEPVRFGEQAISSSHIRRAIAKGDVPTLNAYLGRPYHLGGEIVHGAGRGRLLGFPTANLRVAPELVYPAPGVYAVRAQLLGATYSGALHIGTNPTFGQGPLTIETHLLDYAGDCYGERLDLEFVARLRDQEVFSGAEELKARIALDVAEVRRVLA